ncbi:MAG: ABC transporter permease, partial [Firmicutes bacterium]|nr:ABC transporter permease [Bacillota bacterium]
MKNSKKPNKFQFLIGISLKRKIKTKWFLAANLLLFAVIACGLNIDHIIEAFGGDFNEKETIYVIDNTTTNTYEVFKQQLEVTNKTLQGKDKKAADDTKKKEEVESDYVVKKYDKGIKEAKKLVKKSKHNYVLVFEDSEKDIIKTTLITKDYLGTMDSQTINQTINSTKMAVAIVKSNIPVEQLEKIYSEAKIEREILSKDKNPQSEGTEIIMSTVFPIAILPFFMLTIFLVQMIGAEVNDEKTTRGMEIIISNVSPQKHFFSKVIAGNLFILFQGALLILYAGVGFGLRLFLGGGNPLSGMGGSFGGIIDALKVAGILDKLVYIVPLTLILMVLTFLAYSLLAGVLASMTTNIEDFQQLQTPIMIVSLVGYYLAILANVFGGSLFIKILGVIPFI